MFLLMREPAATLRRTRLRGIRAISPRSHRPTSRPRLANRSPAPSPPRQRLDQPLVLAEAATRAAVVAGRKWDDGPSALKFAPPVAFATCRTSLVKSDSNRW